jgi:hypothetical protein
VIKGFAEIGALSRPAEGMRDSEVALGIEEDVMGSDVSYSPPCALLHFLVGVDEPQKEEPELPLLELAFLATAIVNFFSEEVRIVLKPKLHLHRFTLRVPESPQKPFLLKSFRLGESRKSEFRLAFVEAASHLSYSF